VSAKDVALREFDGHVLRLLQMINKAKPERFVKTAVDVAELLRLSRWQHDPYCRRSSSCTMRSLRATPPLAPSFTSSPMAAETILSSIAF
jgi:hypothetical protein